MAPTDRGGTGPPERKDRGSGRCSQAGRSLGIPTSALGGARSSAGVRDPVRRRRTYWSWRKPSGLPVLPGGLFLENTLLYLVRQRYGAGCSPLHRLGRGTSGAILFTRNARTARSLAAAMYERRIRKVYLALASGTTMPEAFTVDAPIGPVPHRRPATVHAYHPDGRPSISHVRVVRRLPDKNATLLEVTIPTGRPHQIRIHLSYAGFPLVGDPLYRPGGIPRADGEDDESGARPGECGYLLHSWKIRFPHPGRGEDVEVVSPPPPALDPER